jgi:hypothetical protein
VTAAFAGLDGIGGLYRAAAMERATDREVPHVDNPFPRQICGLHGVLREVVRPFLLGPALARIGLNETDAYREFVRVEPLEHPVR